MRTESLSVRVIQFLYHRARLRGVEIPSASRIQALSLLYPDRRPEEIAFRQDVSRFRRLMWGIGLTLAVCAWLAVTPVSSVLHGNYLSRPEPGMGNRRVNLEVQADGQVWQESLNLEEREYTEEEWMARLDQAEAAMAQLVLGENTSLKNVYSSLNFFSECPVEGVRASWTPAEPAIIQWDGSLTTEVIFGEGRPSTLFLELTGGGYERRCELEVLLVDPPEKETSLSEQISREILRSESAQPDQAEICLPDRVEGVAVTYRDLEAEHPWAAVFAISVAAVMGILLYPGRRIRELCRKRDQELAMDYSELAAKLKLLVGAGLSVRSAWEQIAGDYEKEKAEGGPYRILYEEICRTKRALHQGMLEEQAYSDFGSRCGTVSCLRLGGLLESYIRNGSGDLRERLESEANDSFREHLELAKRRGETISSRLLLPLMLLFALVLALTAMPAFLAM